LIVNKTWAKAGIYQKLEKLAKRRSFEDLSISPVITWTSEMLTSHIRKLLAIPGAKVLFGGNPITGT